MPLMPGNLTGSDVSPQEEPILKPLCCSDLIDTSFLIVVLPLRFGHTLYKPS